MIRKLLCNRNTHYGHYIYVPWTLDEKLFSDNQSILIPSNQINFSGPPQQMMSPMQRPPSGMRSASIQNLSHHQQQQHIAQQMGQRQGSHPALMNGGLGPHGPPGPQQQQTLPRVNGDDQGYYQNIGTTNLQQPMPLRYNFYTDF